MSLRLSLAAALGLAFIAATAQADQVQRADGEVVAVRIQTAEFNLNSDAGAQALLQRIHLAAEQICGAAPLFTDLARVHNHNRCVMASVDEAVTRLGAPRVSALNTKVRRSSALLAQSR